MIKKLETITNLFKENEIRIIWDSEKEDYYFSVVDVIAALTGSVNQRHYWVVLKSKDGKYYKQDVLDTEGIFRLIESVSSPNAEPFKLWLAKIGRQEVDNCIDEDYEYAMLTNEIYRSWSGMKANEYKNYKGIRKESLRDNRRYWSIT